MASETGVRERTKYQGVYQRASAERRHEGRPDVCFDITYKLAGGRKVWEKIGWRSEGYTAAMAGQIRAERIRTSRHADMPGVVARGRAGTTIGDAWRAYDEQHLDTTKRPKTDRGRWKLYLSHLERLPIAALTPLELERLKSTLHAKGLSPQTVKHALTLLRRAINYAITMRIWAGENPVREVSMPRVDNQRYRFLRPDEADLLMAEIRKRSEATWRICMMSLHTGMRFGEIVSLRWEAVNLDAGLARVLDPKNGRSRTVSLNASIIVMLAAMEHGTGHVFRSAKSERTGEISCTFGRVVEALGLNANVTDRRGRVVFHTLRHTFASWLALSGVPLYQLMDLMGHRSIQMTKRYASLCPEHGREAVGHIERLMAGATHTSSADGQG